MLKVSSFQLYSLPPFTASLLWWLLYLIIFG
nr:MAG TPA: hypothetical protein [Caudoviricetes sp.]